jgi:hypothetical protein
MNTMKGQHLPDPLNSATRIGRIFGLANLRRDSRKPSKAWLVLRVEMRYLEEKMETDFSLKTQLTMTRYSFMRQSRLVCLHFCDESRLLLIRPIRKF